ncbi:Inhibitor of Bruton tyrosine kinase [Nymphon striatum]|nr:Inhibitor of Bruton tyrosine kinase [Nymphon striatum]
MHLYIASHLKKDSFYFSQHKDYHSFRNTPQYDGLAQHVFLNKIIEMNDVLYPECTSVCKSIQHAKYAIASITHRVENSKLAAFLYALCQNFPNLRDNFGRNVFLMCSSCPGKLELVKWLIQKYDVDLHVKDYESGWTALHRSLYYGHIAVCRYLIQCGANLYSPDNNGYSPLDLIMLDYCSILKNDAVCSRKSGQDKTNMFIYRKKYPVIGNTEVYVWGSNSNYNLGESSVLYREHPSVLEFFTKKKIFVKNVIMTRYHSVFLTNDSHGNVYTCGHGLGGRLGSGVEDTNILPKSIDLPGLAEKCFVVDVAAGDNHIVLLATSNEVFTCGLNKFHQLGHSPPPSMLLRPTKVKMKIKFQSSIILVSVHAANYHTVIETTDGVYTCGLNAGQLGFDKGIIFQDTPRIIPRISVKEGQSKDIYVSNGATVCVINKKDLYIFYEFKCKKIPFFSRIDQVEVIGGHLVFDSASDDSHMHNLPLKLLILQQHGDVFIYENSQINRCLFSFDHQPIIKHLSLTANGVLMVSVLGECFAGYIIPPLENQTANNESVSSKSKSCCSSQREMYRSIDYINQNKNYKIKLERLKYVHNAVKVFSNLEGKSFCVLQKDNRFDRYVKATAHDDGVEDDNDDIADDDKTAEAFENMIMESCIGDNLVDCIIRVDGKEIGAHRYILALRSQFFRKIFFNGKLTHGEKDLVVVEIPHTSFDLLFTVLKCIYTDSGLPLINFCKTLKTSSHLFSNYNSDFEVTFNPHSCHNSKNGDLRKTNISKCSCYGENCNLKFQLCQLFHNKVVSDFIYGKENYLDQIMQEFEVHQETTCLNPKTNFTVQELLILFGFPHFSRSLSNCMCISQTNETDYWCEQFQFPEFSDILLESSDSVTFHCHKCILVSRSEYFKSMLSSHWFEPDRLKPLKIELTSDILKPLLDYIYEDFKDLTIAAQKMAKCEDPYVFLCNLLAAADQFLLSTLKNRCEQALIKGFVTMRSVSELLKFARMYGADYLSKYCMKFICFNLPMMLEQKTLDNLDDDVMDEISLQYKEIPEFTEDENTDRSNDSEEDESEDEENNSGRLTESEEVGIIVDVNPMVGERIITPFSHFPTSKDIQKIADKVKISVLHDHSISKKKSTSSKLSSRPVNVKDKTDVIERTHMSVQSQNMKDTTASLKLQAMRANPSKILDENGDIDEGKVDNVLDTLISETTDQFSNRNSHNLPQTAPNFHSTLSPTITEEAAASPTNPVNTNFPVLGHCEKENNKTTPKYRKKIFSLKKSQKQRKEALSNDFKKDECSTNVQAHVMQWAKLDTETNLLLSEIMNEQKEADIDHESSVNSSQSCPFSPGPNIKPCPSIPSSPTSPSSPSVWGNNSSHRPHHFASNEKCMASFNEILQTEKKSSEKLLQMKSKPLNLIQIEEKAIDELRAFYKKCQPEQIVIIERYNICVATAACPVWRKTA